MTLVGTLMKPIFTVSAADLPPGVHGDGAGPERLNSVVYTVTDCCELALTHRRSSLVAALDRYPEELRGFAYEGAGVAFGALDHFLPWTRRTVRFLDGPGAKYTFAVYLGAGMALARLGRSPEAFRRRLDDDLFNWVVLDGYGFHEGFFRYRRHIQEKALPPSLSGYGLRVFDHGLGRAIWFGAAAAVPAVHDVIEGFPAHRRPDLWAGVGLAAGYTGGAEEATMEKLRDLSAEHVDRLAEGVVIAARARHQVGNISENVEVASRTVLGCDSARAAEIAADALLDLPADGPEPAYEMWRSRIRHTVGQHRPTEVDTDV
ncbi:MAG: DUF1702 family protein [Pseudonocardia sp.]